MKLWRRIWAMCLCMVMLTMVAACGGEEGTKEPDPDTNGGNDVENNDENGGNEESEYPPVLTEENITIEFWHHMGSGALGTYLDDAVARFNETNEFGITVVATYAGAYADELAKVSTAIASKENPVLMTASCSGMPFLGNEDVLTDLYPYIERDGWDLDNVVPAFVEGQSTWGDELHGLPFTRSTAVFYYNKTLWDSLGLEAPENLADLEEKGAYILEQTGNYGFGLLRDAAFYQEGMLKSMNGEGTVDRDGKSLSVLDDGSMLEMLTDWKRWCDDGWCAVPPVTDATSAFVEMFMNGQLASMFQSSGTMGNMLNYATEAGFELGVAEFVSYDGSVAPMGGGDIAILGVNHTDQEIAAAWEFMKFMMEDEQTIGMHTQTGYLPVTYSAAESEEIKVLWEEYPQYKVAFDQLDKGEDPALTIYRSEWNKVVNNAFEYVIMDGSMSPEEAVDYLKAQAAVIFID